MKGLLKFILYSVGVILGLGLTNLLVSLFGEWITTKNSFAVAMGLTGIGVLLGVWGWVVVKGISKAICAFFATHEGGDPMAKYAAAKKGTCCNNECGCPRNK